MTEFRQPLQVQSHLEMPRILVQLGHTQRTWKLAPQTDPKWSPTHMVRTYMSVKCTRRTLRMPSFTRTPHAQPSLSNFTQRDSDFGEPAHSRGTTRLERNFPTSPQNKKTKLSHKGANREHLEVYSNPKQDRFQDLLEAICPEFLHTNLNQIK